MKILILFVFFITLISCNDKPLNKQTQQTNSLREDSQKSSQNKALIPVSSCYSGNLKRDSVKMKAEVFENVVIGTLEYKPYEKDLSTGEFEGHLKGDTLIADYKFASEGIASVRQVIFLIKDSTAVEGHGDMLEKNNRMEFKNIKEVVFDKGFVMKKVQCNY